MDLDHNIVALFEDGVQIVGAAHLAAEAPCGVHGEVGVIAVNGHAERGGGVRDEGANRAEPDDAEGFAAELRTDEGGLPLFDLRGDAAAAGKGAHPLDAADNVARGKQQRAERELLDRLRVRARGVEHGNALLRAARDRDVVRADAGAGDGEQLVAENGVMELRAADEQPVRVLRLHIHCKPLRSELIEPLLRDIVHGFDLKHGFSPHNPS